MSFRSLASLRCAVSLAALLVVSACTDNRAVPLSLVETIDIPVADAGPQANQNINNPTLFIPETFQVADGDQLTLVWREEFDGPEIDPEVWFFATGDGAEKDLAGGWGNNELQYYLPDNAMIVNGVLEITARREAVGNLDYTSARINTEDRFAFQYGRIEASIKLPPGQGIWPAFWMLSQDSDYLCDGEPCIWAATGEIDIMEAVNLDGTGGNEIYGTLHHGGEAPANVSTGDRYTPSVDVTEGFHTYALEWDEFAIRWYFDGQLYAMQNSWDSSADGKDFPAPFDQPFHILLNVAVGGNFPGSPDGSTPFPVTMEVDWVRVYSGEETMGPPAESGTIPDDVIYASNPNETVDLVFGVDYTGFEPFTSGTTFNNNVTTDADFNPAFGVTTGDGYGAQIGQFAIVGFAAGFASGYETLDFKVKGLNEDVIRLKLLEMAASDYVDITLTNSAFATDLGNGWYQVSVPITSFGNAATADGLLFETGGTAPANAYTFLLTDFGFSGTGGGGAADPGTIPDDVIYASDPNETVDLVFGVDYTGFEPFTSGTTFNNNVTTDADFNPAFGVTTGDGYGAQIGQFAIVGFAAGFASGYETLDFKVKGLNEDVIRLKLLEMAASDYVDITLTSSQFATDLGNGWYQVSLPITTFGNAATADGLLFETGGTAPANAYTFLLTDFGFSGTGGGGAADPGTIPDDVIYASDPNEMVDLVFGVDYTGFEPFTSGTTFNNNVTTDADFNPAFGVTTGDGYGAQIGQFAIVGFAAGFASGYETLDFKVKGLNEDVIRLKLLEMAASDYVDITLTSSQFATDLGNGWYQVSIPITSFGNAATADGLLFETGGTAPANAYTFLLTDFGFSGTGGGGDTGGGDTGGGDTGGGEIAVNGGFESGDFSGWETSPGGGIQAITTDNPSSGTYAINLNVPVRTQADPPVDNVIKIANLQAGNLTPGASVTVSFDMRGSLSGAGGVVFAELFSELSGGGTSKSEILGGGPLTPVTAWTNYSFTTTLGDDVSGGVSLQLKASCGPVEGCGVDVFFDNVSIVIGDGGDTGGGDTGGGDTGGGGVGEELAVNGDFETGDLTGWTPDSTTGGLIEVVDTGASGGTYAVHLVAGTTQSPLIKQVQLAAGAVMPNSSVTVSFDMKGTITGVGGVVFAEFFSEGNPVAQQFLGGGPIFPTAEWATYSYTVTTGPDVSQGITLQFVAVCGAEECGVDVFFDNVSITAVLGDAGGGDTGGSDPGVAGGSCGGSEEQASNCDFESGDLTGWTVFDNGGLIEVVDTGTGAGANAAHLVAGPSNNPLIKQFELAAGAVSPGDTVNISFDMRGTLSGEGGVVFAEFFSEGDPTTGEIITGGPIFPTFSWATYTYAVTAGADVSRGITFQLAAVCGAVAGCGVDVFFDNVSIVIPGVSGDTGGGDTGGGDTVLVTFDEATPPVVTAFLGAVATIEAGPAGGGSNDTLRIVRDGGGDRAGATVLYPNGLVSGPATQTISAEFYSPTAGIPVVAVMAFGGAGTGDVLQNETVVVGWQTLTWTFTDLDEADYDRIAFVPNEGTIDTATSYYFDNITQLDAGGGDTGGGAEVVLATFDEVTPPVVTDFGGAVSVIEAGPAGGDGNSLNIVRNGGDNFAGAWIAISAIPSDAGTQTVSALVYSPTAGIPMVAKAEFGENTGTGDVQANETVVVGWQTLTWTFTNLDPAQAYNRFVMLPNLGTVDATATSYFFDNITLLGTGGGG